MSRAIKKIGPLLVIALLASCSLVPKEKTEKTSVAAAEKIAAQNAVAIKRVVEGERTPQQPNVTVSGSSNRVDIAVNPPSVSTKTTVTKPSGGSPYQETTEFSSTTGQNSSTSDLSQAFSAISIPLGVKLILLAIGLAAVSAALWFGIKALKRNSAAAAAAFEMADQGMAQGLKSAHNAFGAAIQRHREKAMASTDIKIVAEQQSEIAALQEERGRMSSDLESERGKLAAKQP